MIGSISVQMVVAVMSVALSAPRLSAQASATNAELRVSPAGAWISLFDGKTTGGWVTSAHRRVSPRAWSVIDGCLVSNGHEEQDILSTQSFRDFELSFQWRFDGAGWVDLGYLVDDRGLVQGSSQGPFGELFRNGGWFMVSAMTLIMMSLSLMGHRSRRSLCRNTILRLGISLGLPISCWVLGINNTNRHRYNTELSMRLVPVAETLPGIGSLGALPGIFAPTSMPVIQELGLNDGAIVVAGNRVEHWLNGVLVLRYQLDGQDLAGATLVQDWPWLREKRSGPILLEHSRDGHPPVRFCNIKIRNLNPEQP